MKQLALATALSIISLSGFTQNKLSNKELSINGFRNPSIGLEYRHHAVSVHAGYYITNFTSGVTTQFIKSGVTCWFLPVGKKELPSSFYAGASILRGINLDYKSKTAFAAEAGFRGMIYKGINLRLGIIALHAKGKVWEINPTPGISYSIQL